VIRAEGLETALNRHRFINRNPVLAMAPVAWMKRAESRVGVEQLAEHKPLAAREPIPLATWFYLKRHGFRSSRIPQAPSGLQRPGDLCSDGVDIGPSTTTRCWRWLHEIALRQNDGTVPLKPAGISRHQSNPASPVENG